MGAKITGHGLGVGGYRWGMLLLVIAFIDCYSPLLSRLTGLTCDST